jgi:hypothetical protein
MMTVPAHDAAAANKNGDPCGVAVAILERVMGIESKPAPLVSNQPLAHRLGRNVDTLDDTFRQLT